MANESGPDWWSVPVQVIATLTAGTVGFLVAKALEWRKKLLAEVIELDYGYSGERDPQTQKLTEGPRDFFFNFSLRFFNNKSTTLGLHRFTVVFRESGVFRHQLFAVDSARNGQIDAPNLLMSSRSEMLTLRPTEWWQEKVICWVGKENLAKVQRCRTVWLRAVTSEGKKKEWKIAEIAPRL